MNKDEVIEQICNTRHIISKEHGHNPARLVEYYQRLQEDHKNRIRTEQQQERLKAQEKS